MLQKKNFKNKDLTYKTTFYLQNKVLMRIGMTAAENDETGDHGLARTVDKTS